MVTDAATRDKRVLMTKDTPDRRDFNSSREESSTIRRPQMTAGRRKPGQRAPESSSFLVKKLGKLVSRLPVEYSGKELGWERGPRLGKDLGTEPDSLLGKEPDKELWSLLAR
jgi:hypothetical protein